MKPLADEAKKQRQQNEVLISETRRQAFRIGEIIGEQNA